MTTSQWMCRTETAPVTNYHSPAASLERRGGLRTTRDHYWLVISRLRGHQPAHLSKSRAAQMRAQLRPQHRMRDAAVVAERPLVAAAAHDEQMLVVGAAIAMPVPVLEGDSDITGLGKERLRCQRGMLAHDLVVIAYRRD